MLFETERTKKQFYVHHIHSSFCTKNRASRRIELERLTRGRITAKAKNGRELSAEEEECLTAIQSNQSSKQQFL